MSTVPPRSSALHAGPFALALALPLALSLALAGCFKNDGGTASDGTETGTGTGTMPTASATDATSATSEDTSGAPTTGTPGSTSDDPPVTTTADPSTGDDTSATVDCNSYCDLVMKNCTGDYLQYGANENCLASCAAFAPGSPGDMSGNSLACRHYHAGAAAMANDVHCGHAGPGGDMACGSNCDGFCAIANEYCPEVWQDNASCVVACMTFDTAEVYDANDVAGDSFACRLYHATAASLAPMTHCSHIKGDSPTCQ